MKKYILSAVALLAAVFSTSAVEIFRTTLKLTTYNDETVEIAFAETPVATFAEKNLVITTVDETKIEYPMADVKEITFDTESFEGIETIAGEEQNTLRFNIGRESLTVDGLAGGARVDLYTVSGVLAASGVADADGHAAVSLDILAPGVYIVSAQGKSFKFIK